MNDIKGSIWRKWDLHVHTPFTQLNNQYDPKNPNNDDVWDKFCEVLENSDVACIGITDYYSINNFIHFKDKISTKFPNSEKIFFPNIEFRLEVSVNKKLEHVNIHVVFDPKCDVDKIKSFLSKLPTNKTRNGATVHCSELLPNEFESASVDYKDIPRVLNTVFGNEQCYLIVCAANNDGLRADTNSPRKMCINDEIDKISDIFFGGSQSTEYFLREDRYEDHEKAKKKAVIAGSDAHSFSDLEEYLGKRIIRVTGGQEEIHKEITWIKADLTFEGFRQITFEPLERVFLGQEPLVETRVKDNPLKYIKSVEISNIEGYSGRLGKWFENEIIFPSKELTAIIGNKGSGKSAIADTIGLVGNSRNQFYGSDNRPEELFSFLNTQKFLKGNIASNFQATITWYDESKTELNLNKSTNSAFPERVEYLPQKYLEKLCANIDDNEFRSKLNSVIFGYVPQKDRYGTTNFESLISYLTEQANKDILEFKIKLHQKNEEIISIEEKLTDEYEKELQEKIKLKEAEIEAHKKTKPNEVPKPAQQVSGENITITEIESIKKDYTAIISKISTLEQEQTEVSKQIEDLSKIRQELEREKDVIAQLETNYKEYLNKLGIKYSDLVSFAIDYKELDEVISSKKKRSKEIGSLLLNEYEINSLDESEEKKKELTDASLNVKKTTLETKHKTLMTKLNKPQKDYQEYIKQKTTWETKLKSLIGDELTPDTLSWYKLELSNVASKYPQEHAQLNDERNSIINEIYNKKKNTILLYDNVKLAIDNEIKKHTGEMDDYNMSIDASLRFDPSKFYEDFFRYIHQGVKGSFSGIDTGGNVLKNICENSGDWNKEESFIKILTIIQEHLYKDKRPDIASKEEKMHIFKQMKEQKDPIEFYDFLFGLDYLQPQYDLKIDNKNLTELSPGERGGLLLIFYLMLDKRDIPLVIDQPEDNLDNKSIYEVLVTFLKKAKKNRQIIMVTHNPNLAVVADAEQIIHTSINKKNKNEFSSYSGAIENPRINSTIVDILEGTMPAFDNRRLKYHKNNN